MLFYLFYLKTFCRSHDQFETDENGIFVGTSPQYADQRMVFNDLGQGVLNNAVQGKWKWSSLVSFIIKDRKI